MVFIPKSILAYAQFLSNPNKPFNYYIEANINKFDEVNRQTYFFNAGVKYRFNEKFSLDYGLQYENYKNDRGSFSDDEDELNVIFGERNREVVQHELIGKYSLTNKMNINLTARYYWSYSQNHMFFNLQNDGFLIPNSTYAINKDRNFNSWNFDLSYSWWFAPGSELRVLYRNYGIERTDKVEKNVQTNFNSILNSDLTNIFSISLRYFIDYNKLKSKH